MIILEKKRSENARTYAIRVLLYNIVHLELPPGSAVSGNELSAILSISRTPVREALIELNRIYSLQAPQCAKGAFSKTEN